MNARTSCVAVLAVVACVASACASAHVGSYLEQGVDLGRARTYSWDAPDTTSTGDPRLDANRFFDERVRAQVETQMATRGFEKITSGTPDVMVRYHVHMAQVVNDFHRDPHPSNCVPPDCRPTVNDEGTFVVDLLDPSTSAVLWRGWVEANFDGVLESQAFMESRIDDAVSKIIKRLPPRL